MLLLAADVTVHLQGRHLTVDVPDLLTIEVLFAAGYMPWVRVRLEYLAATGCAHRPHLATTPRGRRTQGVACQGEQGTTDDVDSGGRRCGRAAVWGEKSGAARRRRWCGRKALPMREASCRLP
jgi:hypothetical protein